MNRYKEPLPSDSTLWIYHGEELIFSSDGKWLYPIFNFQEFLQKKNGFIDKIPLYAHDSAVGKAGLVLLIYNGIKYIHADLVSFLAIEYLEKYNSALSPEKHIILTYDRMVERFRCATEAELAELDDLNTMYCMIRARYQRSMTMRKRK